MYKEFCSSVAVQKVERTNPIWTCSFPIESRLCKCSYVWLWKLLLVRYLKI